MKIDGGCYCGYITYTAEIDPENVGICHCTDCQTFSGSAFRTSVRATKEAFQLSGGTENLCQDGRKRREARPGVLSAMRHVDLFGGCNRSASVQHPRRNRAPARRAAAKITRLVSLRTRLGQ